MRQAFASCTLHGEQLSDRGTCRGDRIAGMYFTDPSYNLLKYRDITNSLTMHFSMELDRNKLHFSFTTSNIDSIPQPLFKYFINKFP